MKKITQIALLAGTLLLGMSSYAAPEKPVSTEKMEKAVSKAAFSAINNVSYSVSSGWVYWQFTLDTPFSVKTAAIVTIHYYTSSGVLSGVFEVDYEPGQWVGTATSQLHYVSDTVNGIQDWTAQYFPI
jgi:hypothetical protein